MDDLSLFKKAKEDDSNSFRILFDRYYPALCRYSDHLINDHLIAEEVVSSVFTNVWKKRVDIEIEYNLSTYLYRAVHNQSINYLKRKRGYYLDMETLHPAIFGSWNNTEEEMNFKELESKVESLIKSMPSQRQKIFRMNKIDCMKYAEIAEVLSISIFTVQNHMSAAAKYMSGFYHQLQN